MNKTTLATALIALAPMGVLATEAPEAPDLSGFYVQGGLTRGEARLSSPNGWSVGDDDTGFNLGAGYQVNNHLAAEARYTDLAGGDAISVLGKVSTDASKEWSAYGLLGATRIDELDQAGFPFKDTTLSYGLGVSWNIVDDMSTSLEYLHAYDDSQSGYGLTGDALSINFLYRL